jgi:hypothetical protein
MGDYTDSFIVDDQTIFVNLKEIIQLKRRNPKKFVLLIGNHDAQYLHFPHYRSAGFRAWAQPALSSLFHQYEAMFQIAYQEALYLFTHAGVTNKWVARLLSQTQQQIPATSHTFDFAALLNSIHRGSLRQRNILFEVGPKRGGADAFSGPVWADRSETSVDFLSDFHQVVGHTPISDFKTFGNESGSITYTDVLETQTRFYEITIPN